MTEPMDPYGPADPTPGGAGPTGAAPSGSDEIVRWLPAIVLGIVLVVLIGFLIIRATGGGSDSASTTITLPTTSSSTTSSTSTSTTTSTTVTTPPTTAAPTTAPPTTAPTTAPTTVTTTAAPGSNAELVQQCNTGDEYACYQVGALGLPPPSSLDKGNHWYKASDAAVTKGCETDLVPTACYVAGSRGLVIGD